MSDRQLEQSPGPTPRGASPWLARAWIAVALIPAFFLLAFAAGEGAYALLGYQPENADAPAWVVVVTSLVVLVVVEAPCVAAAYAGRRAVKEGERRGFYPAVIGVVAAVGWVALTVANEVGNVVRG